NQEVKKGDALFEIDPEDYRLVLEKAKADLAALDRQIEQAHSTLQRLEPLLPRHFTTAENVDEARTKEQTLRAQREGAIATINLEELHLSYCKVIAPFSGRVINLNISAGAHVGVGVPVFSLLDTSKWYVIANFREAEVRHMAPGSEAIVYLSSAPNKHFHGKVQGIGWAVKPEGEIDLPASGVPYVKRELNWVRVAQRFPVRIEVENPDQDLFRMGASAVAVIKGAPPRKKIDEGGIPRSPPQGFRLGRVAPTRVGAGALSRNQNSHHRRQRRSMRDHFNGTASAGALAHLLHGCLHFPGDQAEDDKCRGPGSHRRDHQHWHYYPALQIHLWVSRIARSWNGSRSFSWNVVVTCSSARTAWIPYRLSRRVHAIPR